MKRKIKFKAITALLLTTVLSYLSIGLSFAATETETVDTRNGKTIELTQPIINEDGITLVPFRNITEEIGGFVSWDSNTKTLTWQTKVYNIIKMTIGVPEIDINGEKIPVDVSAKIIDGTTYVPIHVISEVLDADITCDFETKTVTILSENPESIMSDKSYSYQSEFDIADGETALITADINTNSALLEKKLSKEAYNLFKSEIIHSAEDFLNSEIENYGTSIDELKKDAKFRLSENEESLPYTFTLTYDADEFDKFLSIISTKIVYTGGAHPSTVKSSKTYNIETGAVTLEEVSKRLFNKSPDEILTEAKELFREKVKENPDRFYADSEKLIDEMSPEYENFYISKDGLVFYFNHYEIAPYATGMIEVKIPFEK